MQSFRRLLQQTQRLLIAIASGKGRLDRSQESAQRAERGIYRRSFVAAVHHAVGTSWIAGLGPVVLPFGGREQLGKSLRITILQQVAGLLPTENVVGRHAPRRAWVSPLAHEELKEQRRQIEAPVGIAVRKNGAEHAARTCASQEVLLVGGFVVRVSRRKHHAFDAQLHHLVEKRPHTLGICSVEQSRIGSNPESMLERLPYRVHGNVVAALAAP